MVGRKGCEGKRSLRKKGGVRREKVYFYLYLSRKISYHHIVVSSERQKYGKFSSCWCRGLYF